MKENGLSYEEKKICFNSFIEEYKEKSLVEKQNLVIYDLKELIALFQQLCILYNIDYKLLMNREIIDVNNESYSENDYTEAIYVYIQMFKEILSEFLIPMIKDDVKIDN